MMKKALLIVSIIAFMMLVSVPKATALDTFGVAVFVTMENIQVSVVSGSWTIDAIGFGEPTSQAFTAYNEGNVEVDISIEATNTAGWTCEDAKAEDAFEMKAETTGGTGVGMMDDTPLTICSPAKPLAQDVPKEGGTIIFNLTFTAPTIITTTPGEGQELTVTVDADLST